MQGRAFAGPARGAPHDYVYITRDRMDETYDMMRSVQDTRFLYVRNFRPDLPFGQYNNYQFRARGYQSWARMAAEGKLTPATAQFWGEKPSEELYEMATDPDSVKNLAADPAHRGTLEAMRTALRRHTIEINDNGFIPEGSPLEGYDASRAAGAFPVDRVFDLAVLASDRAPANLPKLIAALDDPNEAMRWWAAQGCTMLRAKAAPAEAALRKHLDDESGGVQIAVAEALAALGKTEAALPVLERWLEKVDSPFALQAVNVFMRMGEAARPSLPAMQRVLQMAPPREDNAGQGRPYPHRGLRHVVAVLEGKEPALVYPKP